jgi:hypothetical protein
MDACLVELASKKYKIESLEKLLDIISVNGTDDQEFSLEFKCLVLEAGRQTFLLKDATQARSLFKKGKPNLGQIASGTWLTETLAQLKQSKAQPASGQMQVVLLKCAMQFIFDCFVIDNAKKLSVLKSKQDLDWETSTKKVLDLALSKRISSLVAAATRTRDHLNRINCSASAPAPAASEPAVPAPSVSAPGSVADLSAESKKKAREERMRKLKQQGRNAAGLVPGGSATAPTLAQPTPQPTRPGPSAHSQRGRQQPAGDPNDWGSDTVKLPGMISLSQLESMLPNKGGPKPPRDWEADSNQRRDWRPSVDNIHGQQAFALVVDPASANASNSRRPKDVSNATATTARAEHDNQSDVYGASSSHQSRMDTMPQGGQIPPPSSKRPYEEESFHDNRNGSKRTRHEPPQQQGFGGRGPYQQDFAGRGRDPGRDQNQAFPPPHSDGPGQVGGVRPGFAPQSNAPPNVINNAPPPPRQDLGGGRGGGRGLKMTLPAWMTQKNGPVAAAPAMERPRGGPAIEPDPRVGDRGGPPMNHGPRGGGAPMNHGPGSGGPPMDLLPRGTGRGRGRGRGMTLPAWMTQEQNGPGGE